MTLSAKKTNLQYFRNAYRTGRHGWGVEEPSPYAVRFLKRLRRTIPGARLLDIGCGEGRHAIAAARMGFKVMGVDYEPLALQRARRFATAKGAEGIVFRRADVLHLPASKTRFDVVLDYGCLHHQRKSDWPAYRASVLRVLSHDGYFVLSVFSPQFHLFRGRQKNWHIAQGSYRRCFTRDEILGLLGRDFDPLVIVEENGGRHGFWHALFRRRTPGERSTRRLVRDGQKGRE
jgi:SAM-dependent methyltransferase